MYATTAARSENLQAMSKPAARAGQFLAIIQIAIVPNVPLRIGLAARTAKPNLRINGSRRKVMNNSN